MTQVTVLPSGAVPHVETVWTVVVGGGNGQRFGKQKQYELIGDRRVIDHSKAVAEQMSDGVVVVVPASDAVAEGAIAGGNSRSASVRAGLAAVPDDATIVCVHDAARPLASPALYARVIAAVAAGADAAVPGIPVADTIKVVEADGTVVATPDRSTLVAVQTPQAFRASVLRAAHAGGGDATDDAALIEQAGGTVVVVEGDHSNRKITLPGDLEWVRREMGER
ncbi:MAG: 2-C-methyl-D-erythritol 4-phosphate cytidylyltransferase [Ilumatobacter sp.]|jgi:2-C-methyl-D-erythritol 4-phosphate cytidylyltransferase